MLRINLGSGQRKFGMPRPIPDYYDDCGLCGRPVTHRAHCVDAGTHEPITVDGFVHTFIPFNNWINVDINPKWSPDVVADGAHMPMFADASADLIVSHHNLEHYGCGEAAPMVRECHRILADEGSLIVCVPDMRALAHAWIQGRITTQIYMTNVHGAFMDNEADRHRWGFDSASLRDFLLSCGFSRVVPFDWRAIQGADIAKDFWILAMEAVK